MSKQSKMKHLSLPTYAVLNQVLSKTALKLHPSQVQGLICGILCGNSANNSAWEELVTGGKDTKQTHAVLQELYEASAKQLDEFLFEFQLILPPDSAELSVRAEALTLWCQGLLTGLKIVNIPITNRKPSDVTEAINDFIEIAKMNYEEISAAEEDEAAYTELAEYVRMAVILIYQDLHEINTSKAAKPFNHLH